MSLHSPVASVTGVRVPKLKVRTRPPDSAVQSPASQTSPPSTAAYKTEPSDSDAAGQSVAQSPYSLTQTTPDSPVLQATVARTAGQNRPVQDAKDAFRFPSPSTALGNDPGQQWSRDGPDTIHPVAVPGPASPDRSDPYHAGTAVSGTYELSERHLASLDRETGTDWPGRPGGTTSTKKKSGLGGFFGYFSVKEPSAAALEHYAQSQRKQAELKGVRNGTVGLPGVTDRKLPADVPKVNSKWDGLPDWAREAVKDAKKNDRDRPDALLNKMADHRRPNSQHDSVSTFGSGASNSAGSRSAQKDAKTRQRPETSRSPSKSSSVQKVRNPSRGRGMSRKISGNVPRTHDPDSSHAVTSITAPGLPDPSFAASYFPGGSGTGSPAPDASQWHGKRPSHVHRRTMSDPRLNLGMDNVADITAFLGDEDVSVGKIISKPLPMTHGHSTEGDAGETDLAPRPPRKPVEQQPSRPDVAGADVHPGLDRTSTSSTNVSWQTAEQMQSATILPSPPASPKPFADESLPSNELGDPNATPKPRSKLQVRAIFPDGTPSRGAAAVLAGHARSPTLPDGKSQHAHAVANDPHLQAHPAAQPSPTSSKHASAQASTTRQDRLTSHPSTMKMDTPGNGSSGEQFASVGDSNERLKAAKKSRWSMLGRKSAK